MPPNSLQPTCNCYYYFNLKRSTYRIDWREANDGQTALTTISANPTPAIPCIDHKQENRHGTERRVDHRCRRRVGQRHCAAFRQGRLQRVRGQAGCGKARAVGRRDRSRRRQGHRLWRGCTQGRTSHGALCHDRKRRRPHRCHGLQYRRQCAIQHHGNLRAEVFQGLGNGLHEWRAA